MTFKLTRKMAERSVRQINRLTPLLFRLPRASLRYRHAGGFVAGLALWSLAMAKLQTIQERPLRRQQLLQTVLSEFGRPVFGPWHQAGPFDRRLQLPHPAEEEPDDEAEYQLFGGGVGRWSLMPDYLDGYANVIAIESISSKILREQPTVCLFRTVVAPHEMRQRVFCGANNGVAIWLNGKIVSYLDTFREFAPGQESLELPLAKGENRLVLKFKLIHLPARFFFMPDVGREFGEQLVAKVESDFPTGRTVITNYRERAARVATDVEDRYYRIVEVPNPPDAFIEGGGIDFLSGGRLAISTRRGFVYLVTKAGATNPAEANWHQFASGLHEGFGLKATEDGIIVVQRGELTRLRDTDGNDEADRFESLSNVWGLTGNYHEYAYGLVQDHADNFYVSLNVTHDQSSAVPYRGCLLQVTPLGDTIPFCCGLRAPNGMGMNAVGDIFVADNQGQWVAASPLYHVRKGCFYGHPASLRWMPEDGSNARRSSSMSTSPPRSPPAVWLPYEELSMSATDVKCDVTGGNFGPFAEQLFIGDMTKGVINRIALEKVAGEYQGACFLFRRGCGAVNRMAFGPDHKLYFVRVNRGWGGGGRGDGLARLEFTGRIPFEMHSVSLKPNGFLVRFTKPVAAGAVLDEKDFRLEQYGYEYSQQYGSPKVKREILPLRKVVVSGDRTQLDLETAGLKQDRVCQITVLRIQSEEGDDLLHMDAFYTINQLKE